MLQGNRGKISEAAIIAYCNQKGGPGKSTVTYLHAHAAAELGRRVLAIDMDPQGNLTDVITHEGYVPVDQYPDDQPKPTNLADVLDPRVKADVREVIVHGVRDGISVLPSAVDQLASVTYDLMAMPAGREYRLKEALGPVLGDYDLILIDCPPELGLMMINAITAADGVNIVTAPEQFSINGITRLLTSIMTARTYTNAGLVIAGATVNQVQATKRKAFWLEQAHALLAEQRPAIPVLDRPIQFATWIAEAVEAGVSLESLNTAAARDLARVCREHVEQLESSLASQKGQHAK